MHCQVESLHMPISLQQAILPGVQVFVSQADYVKKTGQQPPAYDPNLPIQLWRDTLGRTQAPLSNVFYPNNNPYRGFVYNLVILESVYENNTVVAGVAVLEPTFVPEMLAQRVNIPTDQSGIKFPSTVFPIRDLLPGESIDNSPFGIWINQG